MREKTFRFKKFEVLNDKTAMKVGTDGVLLGAWCDVAGAKRVLDVGTGCGLIALMVAQRNSSSTVLAIDIDAYAVAEAEYNFKQSAWRDRLQASQQDYLMMGQEAGLFDLIVSNPPFFTNGIKPADEARMNSRHVAALPVGKLIDNAAKLLTTNGKFAFIYPADNDSLVEEWVTFSPLHIGRKVHVSTIAGAAPKRTLWELVQGQTEMVQSTLVIEKEPRVFSEEYVNLTKDFYLKM